MPTVKEFITSLQYFPRDVICHCTERLANVAKEKVEAAVVA